jgi:hypothetical protein
VFFSRTVSVTYWGRVVTYWGRVFFFCSSRHQYLSHLLSVSQWPCSAGWLPASQQCFSLTPVQHQPPATSQPAVFFSHNKSASPATRQPNEANIYLISSQFPNSSSNSPQVTGSCISPISWHCRRSLMAQAWPQQHAGAVNGAAMAP